MTRVSGRAPTCVCAAQLVLQADRERLAGGDALEQRDVGEREIGRRGGLVVVGQPRGVDGREAPALGVAVACDELVGQAVVPRAREPRDFLLQLVERHVGRFARRDVQQEEELRRRALDEREVILHRFGVVARREQLLQAHAQLGRHAVARHGDHDRDVAAGGVAPHRQRDALRLLGARGRDDLGAQRLDRRLEQLVARERLERGDRRLVVVRALHQALGLDDRLQLAAQERRARGLLEIDERREQADHAQQARERAVRAQDAHRDVVHAGAPVHARAAVGLADHEQVAARDEALAQELGQLVDAASAARSATRRRRAGCRDPSRPGPAPRARTGPSSIVVGASAEQDEVAVAQPLEERGRLLDLVGSAHARGRRARQLAMRSTIASIAAKSPTASCSSRERLAHGRDERLALLARRDGRSSSTRMTDSRPLAARASAMCTMRPSASRSTPTIGMQQQAHAVAGALHGGAHRVDEERRVGHVDLERRACGRRFDHAHGDRLQAARVGEVVEAARLPIELLEVERPQPLVQRAAEQHAGEGDQALAAGRALPARDQLFEFAQERMRGVAFAHAAHAIRSSHARGGPAGRSPCAPVRPPRWRPARAARRSRRCGRCASARSSAAGSSSRETGWSSKPTTATSSGMRRPSSRQAA